MYTEHKTYGTFGEELNVPASMLIDAGLPLGGPVSVMIAEGILIIAATYEERQRDLTDELSCIMEELGCDPEVVFTLLDSGEDYDDCGDCGEDCRDD